MKKLLLSSALICLLGFHYSQANAQDKTTPSQPSPENKTVSSPITINQKVGSWELHCAYPNKEEQAKGKNLSQGCIAQQGLSIKNKDNSQTPLATLILEKVKELQSPKKSNPYRLTIITPLGFSLQDPVKLGIEHNKELSLPWVACTTNGCIASQIIDPALQKSLETNKDAHLLITRVNKTTVTINFNIEDLHNVFPVMNELINKKTP